MINAARKFMTGSIPSETDADLPGQTFSHYDNIGNRTQSSSGTPGVGSTTITYAPANGANQYPSITNNRIGIALGTVDPAATVTVNGTAAAMTGPWWAHSKSTTAGTTAAWLDFSITANLTDQTNTVGSSMLVPPTQNFPGLRHHAARPPTAFTRSTQPASCLRPPRCGCCPPLRLAPFVASALIASS